MEFSLWPLGFMEFLKNNNHPGENKINWIENRKIQSKPVGILKKSLRVIASVCMCVYYIIY